MPTASFSPIPRRQLLSGYAPSVGFVIRSEDGNFSLHPGLIIDFRNMTSYREISPRVAKAKSPTKATISKTVLMSRACD